MIVLALNQVKTTFPGTKPKQNDANKAASKLQKTLLWQQLRLQASKEFSFCDLRGNHYITYVTTYTYNLLL